jgi:Cdc6-like AAA superfamily ATPase
LDRHGNLIDLEANARNIAEAREMRRDLRAWREENINGVKHDEEEQAAKQYRSIMSWLKINESEQLKIFESIAEEGSKHPGTCGWILKSQKIKSWLRPKPDTPFIWLQGSPGSGKSVLTTQIVNFIQAAKASVICHMCTDSYATSTKYEHIIRSLLLQLLRRNGELVAYVYQECIIGNKAPAISTLELLLQALFIALSDEPRNTECLWIVLDGLDECESGKQARVISLMDQITSNTNGGTVCKVLISSRPSPVLLKRLRRKQIVSLSDEGDNIEHAIQRYASQRLRSLHERLRQLELGPVDIEEIESIVAKKADGEYLLCGHINSILYPFSHPR